MNIISKTIVAFVSIAQISFSAFASKGIILKDDTNLDYYENDKYVRTLMSLVSTNTLIHFTGNNFYLSKYIPEDKKYSLHVCNLLSNKCAPIITPDNSSDIVDFSFRDNGTGFVAKKDLNIDYYEENRFIKTITRADRAIISVSFNGNSTYFAEVKDYNNGEYSSFIKRCSKYALNCKVIAAIKDSITSISFNEFEEGFAVSRMGKTYRFSNNLITEVKNPLNFHSDNLSFTNSGIYTRYQYTENTYDVENPIIIKTEILKCDLLGNNCKNKYREHGIPVRASFK